MYFDFWEGAGKKAFHSFQSTKLHAGATHILQRWPFPPCNTLPSGFRDAKLSWFPSSLQTSHSSGAFARSSSSSQTWMLAPQALVLGLLLFPLTCRFPRQSHPHPSSSLSLSRSPHIWSPSRPFFRAPGSWVQLLAGRTPWIFHRHLQLSVFQTLPHPFFQCPFSVNAEPSAQFQKLERWELVLTPPSPSPHI